MTAFCSLLKEVFNRRPRAACNEINNRDFAKGTKKDRLPYPSQRGTTRGVCFYQFVVEQWAKEVPHDDFEGVSHGHFHQDFCTGTVLYISHHARREALQWLFAFLAASQPLIGK